MARLPWVDENTLAKAHPRLFHYTRETVLPLILSSGGLLATHYSRTNDRREFTSLRQPLAEAMFQQVMPLVREKTRTGQLNFGGDEAKMMEIARGDAERSFDILVSAAPTPPHITCFSAHGHGARARRRARAMPAACGKLLHVDRRRTFHFPGADRCSGSSNSVVPDRRQRGASG